MNLVDILILTIIGIMIALIVRGMLRGTIRTCDSDACSGDCGACGHVCSTPRIRLTDEQLAQLKALDEKGHLA